MLDDEDTPRAGRMWVGFVLMFAWTFGWVGYAGWLLVTWHPYGVVGACALSWFGGIALAKPIARLVMIGVKQPQHG